MIKPGFGLISTIYNFQNFSDSDDFEETKVKFKWAEKQDLYKIGYVKIVTRKI